MKVRNAAMQITHDQLTLLWNVDVMCQRCIRSVIFFDVASDSAKNVWAFTQNCYGEIAVILWCKVFGGEREPTHYRTLFSNGPLGGVSGESARQRVLKCSQMSEEEYRKFWRTAKAARDKFLVHNEFNTKEEVVFPDLDVMSRVCCEMRDIVRQIATSTTPAKPTDEDFHRDIVGFTTSRDNARFISVVRDESRELAEAIRGRGFNSD